MKKLTIMTLLVLAISHSVCLGSGMLIPKDKSLPPLAIKYQRVDIRVKDSVATAKIEQVFKNSTNRDLEAIYVFPLPEGATIADFAMYINGKRMSGEVVEKGKARKIYQDIVRRMKDPGLLEHMGDNLFRVSVYPVPKNGEQKFELEYSQELEYEAGLYKLVYPLRTSEKSSRLLEDFTVSARVTSSTPLKSIYSPSHEIGISRKGEHEAIIGFEEERSVLDKDFVLYYGVSKKDFGLNLLTHATSDEDGYFMMMLAPSVAPPKGMVIKKDVTFVFDTSGSMSGKKIEQARSALAYCIEKLNDGDRFNIIRFSTDVESFKKDMVTVDGKTREAALEFVKDIEARGGTAIHDALQAALAFDYERSRPNLIVFLTDGKPTIGESNIDVIAGGVDKKNQNQTRIFVFGVGDGVNTHLLDKISSGNGGVSRYVKTDEDIEVKVSSLSDKISQPVLGKPVLTIDKITTRQLHPRELPDLFAGDQLKVFGRYKADGHVAVRLTGEVNGKKREFVYEVTFPAKNSDNTFIPRLWATRRIGYLMEEIRLQGEKSELEEEVIRLGKEHGIMTPYTSYLVLENEKQYGEHRIERPGRPMARRENEAKRRPAMDQAITSFRAKSAEGTVADSFSNAQAAPAPATVPVFEADEEALSSAARRLRGSGKDDGVRFFRSQKKEVNRFMDEKSGRDAVNLSMAIQQYKQQDRVSTASARVRRVGKKTFYLIHGVWVDSSYKEGIKEIKISFASDEYFELLQKKPELKAFFAIGEKLIVCAGDQIAYVIE